MELILFCSAVEAIILGIKSIKKKNNSKKNLPKGRFDIYLKEA